MVEINELSRPSWMQGISLDVFRGYFLAKAFDVVGNGSYKKHLSQCREVGDPWAVEMTNSVQAVQNCIKEIAASVQCMPQTSNRLHEICRDVMMSAQPPIKLHAGCVTCSITGRQCMRCLDLSKNHKGNSQVYVDARFCYFFMLLWYCNKLEYVVRSFTRTWLDSRSLDETFQDVCRKMQEDMEGQVASMHRLFVAAHAHIASTLAHYSSAHKLTLVLSEAGH